MNFLKLTIPEKRIYGLDILRAFAILFVVIEHGGNLLPDNINDAQRYVLPDGVSVFFVLSGFLIGGILIKTFETEPAGFKTMFRFLSRRWLRTLPAYYVVLMVLIIIALCKDSLNTIPVLNYFTFTQNFAGMHPPFFPEAWSLCVEEWFYLITAAILFFSIGLCKLHHKKIIPAYIILVIIASLAFRYYKYTALGADNFYKWDELYRKVVVMRLDSLLYGVLAAYASVYYKQLWQHHKVKLFALGIILIVFQKTIDPYFSTITVYQCVFSFSVNAIAIMLLLPFLSDIKTGSGVAYKFITYVSLTSYSIYLLNLSFVQLWLLEIINWPSPSTGIYMAMKYLLYWALTLVLSVLLYKYVELPVMRLRNKRSHGSLQ